jgi:hypothetical protein
LTTQSVRSRSEGTPNADENTEAETDEDDDDDEEIGAPTTAFAA